MEIVHEPCGRVEGVGGGFGLLGGDVVEGWEDAAFAATTVMEEGAGDGLDATGANFVEERGIRGLSRILWPFGAINGC